MFSTFPVNKDTINLKSFNYFFTFPFYFLSSKMIRHDLCYADAYLQLVFPKCCLFACYFFPNALCRGLSQSRTAAQTQQCFCDKTGMEDL